jgi:dynactin-4
MPKKFPYSYIACPCSGIDHNRHSQTSTGKEITDNSQDNRDVGEEDNTFDPRSPRSIFSLYPLENLLYCEDCHEIKCQRCVLDEIVCWFCPGCLFEVGGSSIRSEGNR